MCAGGPPCNITTDASHPSEAEPGGVGRSGASRSLSSSGILRWADDRWVYPTSACIGGLPSIDIASLAEHCARAGNAESLLHAYVERKVSEQPSPRYGDIHGHQANVGARQSDNVVDGSCTSAGTNSYDSTQQPQQDRM